MSEKDVIPTNEAVLSVSDLVVRFESGGRQSKKRTVRAVDGVSFEIVRGEILALVGESGCGKSTIAMAVMRLIKPTSGQIISGGLNLATIRGRALQRARQRIQMIFQDPFGSLDPRQTVMEAVSEPLLIHKVGNSAGERTKMVFDALRMAQLNPPERLSENFPHELSGGQRQRVAIASAMVLSPELVVADEPVSMLDVSARAGILRLMMDLRDRLGVSYLFITHDLATAWVVADRIAVVYLGRIVETGPSEVVVKNPAHPYTQALLNASQDGDTTISAAAVVLKGEAPSAAAVPPGCRFHPRCPKYVELGKPESCRSEDPRLHVIKKGEIPRRDHSAACHFTDEVK